VEVGGLVSIGVLEMRIFWVMLYFTVFREHPYFGLQPPKKSTALQTPLKTNPSKNRDAHHAKKNPPIFYQ
jgi:hypothetical protein